MAAHEPDDHLIDMPVGLQRWQRAVLALRIVAIARHDVGGVRLSARHGPVRQAWLNALQSIVSAASQRVVPANVTDDRLVGAIDLAATLAAGQRVDEPGLLSGLSADGVVILQGYDRMEAGTLGLISQAWDRHRFALVAIDESERGDPETEARLRLSPNAIDDRTGLWLDLDGIAIGDCGLAHDPAAGTEIEIWDEAEDAEDLRSRYLAVSIGEQMLADACQLAARLGVRSLRALMATLAGARVVAVAAGRDHVVLDDLMTILPLTLLPRATEMPARDETPEDFDDADDQPPDEEDPLSEPDAPQSNTESGPLDDQLIAAAEAVLPPDLLGALASFAGAASSGASGSSGVLRKRGRKGRRFGARHAHPDGAKKLNIIETLRAAAPWQKLRSAAASGRTGEAPSGIRVRVRKQDFRVYRQKELSESLAVFVVDASGSSAVQRFGEAKGAIELLLGESYARRDHVALIAVRGHHAELLLPATRSLTRAKRVLSGLPGGGGTPLASGIDIGLEVALAAAHRGQSPMIVVLTDGQSNVSRGGRPGRKQAAADALDAGRAVMASGFPSVVLDTSNRPQPRAAEIAAAMGARYMPLPRANATELANTVASIADRTREERVT